MMCAVPAASFHVDSSVDSSVAFVSAEGAAVSAAAVVVGGF